MRNQHVSAALLPGDVPRKKIPRNPDWRDPMPTAMSSQSLPMADRNASYANGTHVDIAVIESTFLVPESAESKSRVLVAFNVIIEEEQQNRSLIRYVPDFVELDQRLKENYRRKYKVSLPQLVEPEMIMDSQKFSSRFGFLWRFSLTRVQKSNSEKLEAYLQQCAQHPAIRQSSLFREFLSKQRPEDEILPKFTPERLPEIHCDYPRQPSAITSTSAQGAESSSNRSSASLAMYSPSQSSLHCSQAKSLSISTHPHSNNDSSDIIFEPHVPSIHDFTLIKVLGKGCMGKVLLVESNRTSRRLALKAINKKTVIEQQEVAHIKMERDILKTIEKMRHPFLIRFHCAFQNPNQLFLVLDYHPGGDMATQLAISQTFSPARCKLYTAEILLGLQELHRLNILYRDLKPENILLGADGHIVLTDFGLSKQFPSSTHLDDQRTQTFCGTPEYLAPEVLEREPYSYAVDFWSLGTILFEMLVGVTPFWADNRGEMYRRVLQDDLVFPDDVDPVTQDFLARLLHRNPSRRLGTGPDGPILIRSHPYFRPLDWSDVYHKRLQPEYIPDLRSTNDFSHFDDTFLRMTPRLSPVSFDNTLADAQQDFEGYSFVSSLYSEDTHPLHDVDLTTDATELPRVSSEQEAPQQHHHRHLSFYSESDIRPDDFNLASFDEDMSDGYSISDRRVYFQRPMTREPMASSSSSLSVYPI